jgi:SNF2 family DNA or RNA helicase
MKELGIRNALILAPKAVLEQWAYELDKWWPGHLEVCIRPSSIPKNKIVITNYEQARSIQLLAQLKNQTWDVLVMDEMHKLKNRRSQVWKAVVEIPAYHKIGLSGTPVLRRIDDLWAQLFILDWRFSGLSYWNFIEYFCETQPSIFNKGLDILSLTKDGEKFGLLQWLLRQAVVSNPDMLLTKGKQVSIINLKMEGKQKQLYQDTKKLIYESLPEEMTIVNAMTHMLRLRQVTSCPKQFEPKCNNIKVEWLLEQIEDNPGQKFIVYSCFEKTVQEIKNALNSLCVTYTGKNSSEENKKNKELFIDSEVPVIAGTIGSMGTGVDGLQYASSTVVFFDRDWSPKINEQAEDRANRWGQKELVNVFYLEVVGTVDRHVARINLSKSEDIRRALS